jgi:glycosyltransferase involved in cell wall biosynthesis
MRIGLDYTSALRQRAGIGRYTRGIVGALADLDHSNQYTLIAPRDAGALPAVPANMRVQRLPLTDWLLTIAWHRLRLPLYVDLFTGPLDIFHSPDFVLPPVRRAHAIVTVHDLSFLRYPECAARGLVAYLSSVVPRSLRRADLILADSSWTRQDLVTMLGMPADKISVVPAGVGPEYRPVADQSALEVVRRRYDLPRRFILHVGTLEPRKNLVRLIEALHSIAKQEPETCLVLVGGKGWLYDDIFASVERLGLSGKVTFPGFIAEADLPAVYNLATVFAYPSLYEGFGIPPLEAMACGVPVVCSNSSSLPEVVGDAALFVEPTDTAALAGALLRALNDEPLRQTLRQCGFERVRLFSWPAAARKLLTAYESLL